MFELKNKKIDNNRPLEAPHLFKQNAKVDEISNTIQYNTILYLTTLHLGLLELACLQVRLIRGSLFKYKLHSTLFNDIPHMNLQSTPCTIRCTVHYQGT